MTLIADPLSLAGALNLAETVTIGIAALPLARRAT